MAEQESLDFADEEIKFYPAICDIYQEPYTHFIIQDSSFTPVCEKGLKFNLKMLKETQQDFKFGRLVEALKIADDKVQKMIPFFEDSIDSLRQMKVKLKIYAKKIQKIQNFFASFSSKNSIFLGF